MSLLKRQPALALGSIGPVVTALLGLAIAMGVPLTEDQQAAILVTSGSLITLVTSFMVKNRVSPVAEEGSES